VILLCDEDVGTGVPRALAFVDYPAHALYDCGLSGQGDVDWLTVAGRGGLLVFSRNKRMLKVPQERATIINERVGIIFLTTGQESPARMLRLLLNKWDVLEFLDTQEQRPFARFLSPNGQLSVRFRDFQL
jgi:hypothetical protein